MPRASAFRFTGATAVVTGAASGMGEQMAHQLARRGTNVVLLDRDADRLEAVATAVGTSSPTVKVDTTVVDLSAVDSLGGVVDDLLTRNPSVDLLINNAGIAFGGSFEQLSSADFDSVMDINFRAPVELTRRLLPTLRQSRGAHIVNISSLFGIIAPPGQSAYAASKFAIRGFSECLRHELAPAIGVTVVHPGGIKTRIAETAGSASGASADEIAAGKATFAKLLKYPADKAATRILDGVEKRRGRVLIAPEAHAADVVARLFPARYQAIIGRSM